MFQFDDEEEDDWMPSPPVKQASPTGRHRSSGLSVSTSAGGSTSNRNRHDEHPTSSSYSASACVTFARELPPQPRVELIPLPGGRTTPRLALAAADAEAQLRKFSSNGGGFSASPPFPSVPQVASEGDGGTYMLIGTAGRPVAVFKPSDEEPRCKKGGHRPGEEAEAEAALMRTLRSHRRRSIHAGSLARQRSPSLPQRQRGATVSASLSSPTTMLERRRSRLSSSGSINQAPVSRQLLSSSEAQQQAGAMLATRSPITPISSSRGGEDSLFTYSSSSNDDDDDCGDGNPGRGDANPAVARNLGSDFVSDEEGELSSGEDDDDDLFARDDAPTQARTHAATPPRGIPISVPTSRLHRSGSSSSSDDDSDSGEGGHTALLFSRSVGTGLQVLAAQRLAARAKEKNGPIATKRSIPVGATSVREVAAFLLDSDGRLGVPETSLARVTCPALWGSEVKEGSLQLYVAHDAASWDYSPSRFVATDVFKVAILDIRTLNSDRHGGNILVRMQDAAMESASGATPCVVPSARDKAQPSMVSSTSPKDDAKTDRVPVTSPSIAMSGSGDGTGAGGPDPARSEVRMAVSAPPLIPQAGGGGSGSNPVSTVIAPKPTKGGAWRPRWMQRRDAAIAAAATAATTTTAVPTTATTTTTTPTTNTTSSPRVGGTATAPPSFDMMAPRVLTGSGSGGTGGDAKGHHPLATSHASAKKSTEGRSTSLLTRPGTPIAAKARPRPSHPDPMTRPRSAGGLVMQRTYHLVPIDHGFCLPTSFSEAFWEWHAWAQCRLPFDCETQAYIAAIDEQRDGRLLTALGLEPEAVRVSTFATIVLKMGVANGLTLAEIADICARTRFDERTKLESMQVIAKQLSHGDEEDMYDIFHDLVERCIAQVKGNRGQRKG